MKVCNIPTVKIEIDDCVGDSLGKHNYNFLALDTNICNLSSVYFNNQININSAFNQLSSLLNSFIPIFSSYDTKNTNDFLTTSTTVKLLSSVWSNNEFTVHYPINILSLPSSDNPNYQDPTAILDVFTDSNIKIDIKYIVARVYNSAIKYLNQHFAPKLFTEGTIANVVFFTHNLNPSKPSLLIHKTITPNIFTASNRKYNHDQPPMVAEYTRDDVHLQRGLIVKFQIVQGQWLYLGELN
jgi:hypothetical protein